MPVPIYAQFTFGSTTNLITFNDKSQDYVFKARRRYATQRDIRQFDTVVPDESGVVDYQTLIGKMYYVVEGTLYGRNESSLYIGMEKLRKATSPAITQEDVESDNGYLPIKWSENVDKQIWAKPLYVDIPETRRSAMKPSFRILFKIKRPFIESQAYHTTTFSADTTSGVGLPVPTAGIEINTGGVGVGADTGSGSGIAENIGDYKAYPTINITAPINKPRITNGATGKYIEFNYNLSTGTANITMDYDGIVATTSGGVNLLQYLTASSDIENFYLRSGENQLTLTATSIGSGADITVSWKDFWPI